MNKPNEKQLDAIVRMSGDESFKVFVNWVQESYIAMALASIDIDKEPQRSWYQGRAQELRQFLDAIRTAREAMTAQRRED